MVGSWGGRQARGQQGRTATLGWGLRREWLGVGAGGRRASNRAGPRKVGDKRLPPELNPEIRTLLRTLTESGGKFHDHQLILTRRGDDVPLSWAQFGHEAFRNKQFIGGVCTQLVKLIRERFPAESVGTAGLFKVFRPDLLAAVADDSMSQFGVEEVTKLGAWFKVQLDEQALVEQWKRKAVPLLVVEARKAKRSKGKGQVGARAFYKSMLQILGPVAPEVCKLIEIMLVLQPASAEVERGFSAMNDIKSFDRTSLALSTLDALMRLSLCGPKITVPGRADDPPYAEFDSTVLPAVLAKWHEKVRVAARSSHNARPTRAGDN
ncbi:hypothetical protein TSOC_001283 [Tetrabaena socialis]|uniref:HAT C-terminal dimerisation domain-containing protein n=1 Tax=Tetrabaena socialis TaxID=47790 RepID=A0A2J8AH83_9CHLO|nr:hypothetical protein TSOC_001283 [Tetrabaena socialis]|eukprot:PNH11870.1 hypothetical protein TSOC_001283 [Tetrabaena socialis]